MSLDFETGYEDDGTLQAHHHVYLLFLQYLPSTEDSENAPHALVMIGGLHALHVDLTHRRSDDHEEVNMHGCSRVHRDVHHDMTGYDSHDAHVGFLGIEGSHDIDDVVHSEADSCFVDMMANMHSSID